MVGFRVNGLDIEDKRSQFDVFSALVRGPKEY